MSEQQTNEAALAADLEEEWNDEDYDEDDDDIDAEAEEMARRLNEQLWEDIGKAKAATIPSNASVPADESPSAIVNATHVAPPLPTPPAISTQVHVSPTSRKDEAVMVTIKAILSLLEKDAVAHSTLASAAVPNTTFKSVLDALKQTLSSGTVARTTALSFSQSLVALARGETLFGKLRHSNASSILLDLGKRKREQHDEGGYSNVTKDAKLYPVPILNLYSMVSEAVRVVNHALATSPTSTLDPGLIASIQLPLHHIFLFAVTSSARGGPEMNTLQEIGGLIQVLAVLSGIQIGQMPPTDLNPNPLAPPGTSPPATDIGAAVYPCMVANCGKTFARLYSLRNHTRVHAAHRPYRCQSCPASFLRNHDLKRHARLHEKTVFKCTACDKSFSRRDAIKRHKNLNETKGEKGQACFEAEILEVEVDDGGGDDTLRETKRAKLWNGIASNEAPVASPVKPGVIEEGEIPHEVIVSTQAVVLHLRPALQAYVSNSSGMPFPHHPTMPVDAASGQATLASVIARAQSQSLPAPVDEGLAKALESVPPHTGDAPPVEAQAEDVADGKDAGNQTPMPALSMYGLSDEQTKMLEEAITNAALAAQAQAEAEADLEEDDEDEPFDQDSDADGEADLDLDMEPIASI